jgi:hypothetical protein
MNDIANKNLGFSTALTSSFPVKPCLNASADVNTRVSGINNKVPPVPLNSCDIINGKEEHWLPSYIEDTLYIEMCEAEILDPQGSNGDKISRYYIEASKYARRISAGNFGDENTKYKPIFEVRYNDFTARLQAELELLLKDSPDTLKRIVQNAVFRIFKAKHKLIFYDYIESEGLNWRFILD